MKKSFAQISVISTAALFALSSSQAFAAMRTIFGPANAQGIVLMQTAEVGQPEDTTPQRLFDAMNVPEDTSSTSRAKGIQINGRILVLACNTRGNYDVYTCSVAVKKSDRSVISVADQKIEFVTDKADEAKALFDQFHATGTDLFEFQSDNGNLTIKATPARFEVKYQRHTTE